MRRFAWIGLVLVVGLLTGGSAGAQLVDVPDVEETTSNVVGTVTSAADDVVDGVAGSQGGVLDTSGGVEGAIAGTAGAVLPGANPGDEAGDSASSRERSARESGRARDGSSRPQERTRFDRLPRRLEALLERIELGRHVRANLRRLEQALASASPELRARVLRLIRAEIDRLQRGGTTPRERRRIERLRLALERLDEAPAPAPEPTTASAPGEPVVPIGSENNPLPSGGALGERAEGGGQRAEGDGASPAAPNAPSPRPFPPGDGGVPFVLGLVLLFLIGLGIAGVIGGVFNNTRRARSG
jgi:hypothetical protein